MKKQELNVAKVSLSGSIYRFIFVVGIIAIFLSNENIYLIGFINILLLFIPSPITIVFFYIILMGILLNIIGSNPKMMKNDEYLSLAKRTFYLPETRHLDHFTLLILGIFAFKINYILLAVLSIGTLIASLSFNKQRANIQYNNIEMMMALLFFDSKKKKADN